MADLFSLLNLGGYKRKARRGGVTVTPTFDEPKAKTISNSAGNSSQVLRMPFYREHLNDLYADRLTKSSADLIKDLIRSDPDMSATVNSYLTVANTEPVITVKDQDGNLDAEGFAITRQIINRISYQFDYSEGFKLKPSLLAICAEMRYMLLMRGGIGTELVFDRTLAPAEIRQFDTKSVKWTESTPGNYKPKQEKPGSYELIDLDYPSIAITFYRRDPTEIYTGSPFVSAINTIAARQQVINDMYRIMSITGYPRVDIEVLEEVILKSAPADVTKEGKLQAQYLRERLQEIANLFGNIRPDQPFIHWDSVKAKIINDRQPGVGVDISKVIDVLNAQNQAALKTMATVIGRGESGVNTGTVEARIFALNADEVNVPVADNLSKQLTLALRMQGRPSTVEFKFRKVELRPALELENHLTMRQARLLELLSHGIISDDRFYLEMYGEHAPVGSPKLSGTGFYSKTTTVDASKTSPNNDPLGRSLTGQGGDIAKKK